MEEAVIVDAVRTPLGKRSGVLSDWHPADLAAETLKALAERNSLDPVLVDDVIMGCVSQAGDQTWNIGRNAVLGAGWRSAWFVSYVEGRKHLPVIELRRAA